MSVSGGVNRINNELSIALCTCEGSSFLYAQLQSILTQSYLPGELVICDDASTDDTVKIIEKFSTEASFPVHLHVNEKRLGVVQNFSQAIGLCKYDYITPCDQDDIWLPHKLQALLDVMLEAETAWGKETPMLVHSDLKVIETAGQVALPSFMRLRKIRHQEGKILNSLLVQNFITGCTILANRSLIDLALPIPAGVVMHDWWLALIASALGNILFIENPTVLYRKHNKNTIGAIRFLSGENVARIFNLSSTERKLADIIKQAFTFKERLKNINETPIDILSMLDNFTSKTGAGGLPAVKSVIKDGVLCQGLLRNMLYLFLLQKGGYRQYL